MNLLLNSITKHQKSIKLVFTIIALYLVKQQSATVTDVESSFKDESFDPENVNLEENLVELSSHIAELPMSLLNSEQHGYVSLLKANKRLCQILSSATKTGVQDACSDPVSRNLNFLPRPQHNFAKLIFLKKFDMSG